MKLLAPRALTSDHKLEGFDSGSPAMDEWLIRHALQAQAAGSARTFVTVDEHGKVGGYFSLAVGQVDVLEVPERIRRGMGRFPVPVVVLARLAVSRTHQGKGIGAGLLREAILRTLVVAEQAGVRAMLTHPIDAQAEKFYQKYGFAASPLQERQLLLLLKDAKASLNATRTR